VQHTIDELRGHLFATLAALRDENKPMDIDRARAISRVAQTVIDTAKVDVDYLRVVGGGQAPFFGEREDDAALKKLPGDKPGITGRTVHRIKG